MPSFIDKTGARQEVTLGSDLYRAAKAANMSVRTYINTKYPTCEETDTFTQFCSSEGLFFKASDAYGINSTPLHMILDPPVKEGANVSHESPVQSRLLFPSALLGVVEDKLARDRQSPTAIFDQMVAITTTVPSARTEQPVISYSGKSGPEDFRAQQISQLSLPPAMMTITASETTRTIPTFSMGLAISDEALKYATIDLVALALTRQKEIEMFKLAGEALMDMLDGDVDNGQSALSPVKANVYDSSIVANGEVSHLAWMKWLNLAPLYRRIDWVIVDSLATAMAIEARAGKPVVVSDDPNSRRIDTIPRVMYPDLSGNVNMFVAPSDWAMTANTVMGIQSNSAIAKLINSSANYESSERWALRKGEAMRFDFGQFYRRLYDEAFSVLSLTT